MYSCRQGVEYWTRGPSVPLRQTGRLRQCCPIIRWQTSKRTFVLDGVVHKTTNDKGKGVPSKTVKPTKPQSSKGVKGGVNEFIPEASDSLRKEKHVSPQEKDLSLSKGQVVSNSPRLSEAVLCLHRLNHTPGESIHVDDHVDSVVRPSVIKAVDNDDVACSSSQTLKTRSCSSGESDKIDVTPNETLSRDKALANVSQNTDSEVERAKTHQSPSQIVVQNGSVSDGDTPHHIVKDGVDESDASSSSTDKENSERKGRHRKDHHSHEVPGISPAKKAKLESTSEHPTSSDATPLVEEPHQDDSVKSSNRLRKHSSSKLNRKSEVLTKKSCMPSASFNESDSTERPRRLRDKSLLSTPEFMLKQRQYPVDFRFPKRSPDGVSHSRKTSPLAASSRTTHRAEISDARTSNSIRRKAQAGSNSKSTSHHDKKVSPKSGRVSSSHKKEFISPVSQNNSPKSKKESAMLNSSKRKDTLSCDSSVGKKMSKPGKQNSSKTFAKDLSSSRERPSRLRNVSLLSTPESMLKQRQYPIDFWFSSHSPQQGDSSLLQTSTKVASSKITKCVEMSNTKTLNSQHSKQRPNSKSQSRISAQRTSHQGKKALSKSTAENASQSSAEANSSRKTQRKLSIPRRSANKILQTDCETKKTRRGNRQFGQQDESSVDMASDETFNIVNQSQQSASRTLQKKSKSPPKAAPVVSSSQRKHHVSFNETVVGSQRALQRRNLTKVLEEVSQKHTPPRGSKKSGQTVCLWREEGQTCVGTDLSPLDVIFDSFLDLEHQLCEAEDDPVARKLVQKVFKGVKQAVKPMIVKTQLIKDMQKSLKKKKAQCAKLMGDLKEQELVKARLQSQVSELREGHVDTLLSRWMTGYSELMSTFDHST
ncbi:uncharacterized protein LOC101854852 isoform X2 [Aplysia californica]|uniref:Uncharacterized protein LOC101854852 isoform X2 n=1 Tax=Aplysia californica TaxID=6500 RepID=A0ABM1VPA9_APLCA|nr:uncharacterized protein LOC101854852 isoform X2 [Aplysia californica]